MLYCPMENISLSVGQWTVTDCSLCLQTSHPHAPTRWRDGWIACFCFFICSHYHSLVAKVVEDKAQHLVCLRYLQFEISFGVGSASFYKGGVIYQSKSYNFDSTVQRYSFCQYACVTQKCENSIFSIFQEKSSLLSKYHTRGIVRPTKGVYLCKKF